MSESVVGSTDRPAALAEPLVISRPNISTQVLAVGVGPST